MLAVLSVLVSFDNTSSILTLYFAHPGGDALTSTLLEGKTEGAVAAVATFDGQLLGNDRLSGSGEFIVATDEVIDALIINIDVVSDAFTGEILAEIVAVSANSLGQLGKVQIVLQVELRVYAVLN